jgi:hypothetical protein
MQARELMLDLDPWSLFRTLASKERPFFIDAGQPWGEDWVSSMGFRPRMQFRVTASDPAAAPLATLDTVLADVRPDARARRRPSPVRFAGGVVAALAYETRHALERGTPVAGEAPTAPRLAGAVYDAALSYDHRTRRWWLASWHLGAHALTALARPRSACRRRRSRRISMRPPTPPASPASTSTSRRATCIR